MGKTAVPPILEFRRRLAFSSPPTVVRPPQAAPLRTSLGFREVSRVVVAHVMGDFGHRFRGVSQHAGFVCLSGKILNGVLQIATGGKSPDYRRSSHSRASRITSS